MEQKKLVPMQMATIRNQALPSVAGGGRGGGMMFALEVPLQVAAGIAGWQRRKWEARQGCW